MTAPPMPDRVAPGTGAVIRRELPATAFTMLAVLLSFGSALALRRTIDPDPGIAVEVVAVVISLTQSRTQRGRDLRHRLTGLVLTPLVAGAAIEVASLLIDHETLADALFVVALSGAVWLRRFPRLRRAASFVPLPFIALLVTPAPPSGHAPPTGWIALAALIAYAWVTVVWLVAEHRGLVAVPTLSPAPGARPAAQSGRRLQVSDRMALQLACALAAAFALGRWLLPGHWAWIVLTVFIVSATSRGRGDVVYKSVQRTGGAVAGTVAVTLLASALPGHHWSTVALIFVVLAVASLLRTVSYAYWAAGVTGAVAALYSYSGQHGARLLDERVGAIVLGGALAVAAAWCIAPLPARDVLRARSARLLAAVSALLDALRTEADPSGAPPNALPPDRPPRLAAIATADRELREIAPAHRAHHRVRLHRTVDAPHAVHAIDALHRVAAAAADLGAAPPADPRALGLLARQVGQLRRALAGRDALPTTTVLPAALATSHAAAALDAAVADAGRALAVVARPAPPPPAAAPSAPRDPAAQRS